MLVKITKVFKSDKNKDGVAYVTKKGKPYTRVSIQTEQTGNDYYSTTAWDADHPAMQLTEGQEIELIFTEKDGFKNFDIPKPIDLLEARVKKLEDKVFGDE